MVQVSRQTPTKGLSRFILRTLKQGEKVTLRAIGAGSNNQVCKAIASANLSVQGKGNNMISTDIAFKYVDGTDRKDITALEYTLTILKKNTDE